MGENRQTDMVYFLDCHLYNVAEPYKTTKRHQRKTQAHGYKV